jgi:chaperone required for assembly of F1-ATPase
VEKLFKDVAVKCAEGSFSIALDDQILRTPNNGTYALPTHELAMEIAAEWQAQEVEVDPKTMPLTIIAGTAVDRVEQNLAEVVEAVVRYASTDLLCYRASQPVELAEQQRATWQPLLDWASANLGVPINVTEGIIPIEQDTEVIERLRSRLTGYDHFWLASIHGLTTSLGSIFLALAVLENHIDAERALAVCHIEEEFQEGKWGIDDEAAERRDAVRTEVLVAARFLTLLRGQQSAANSTGQGTTL